MMFTLFFSGLPSSSVSIAYYKLSTVPSIISYILVIVGEKNVLQVNKTQTILKTISYLCFIIKINFGYVFASVIMVS